MKPLSPLDCAVAGLPHVAEVAVLLRQHFAPVTEVETIPLATGLGRILVQDGRAAMPMPPFDRSAMDGYAFAHGARGVFKLIGHATAAKAFDGVVGTGECVAISTGARLPGGCDTVAMREHCVQTPDGLLLRAKAAGDNVRRQGEDFCQGDSLAPAGSKLDARHIGLLASAGLHYVTVRRRLRVAIFSIGDELGSEGLEDANRPMLQALCAGHGISVTDMGILADCRASIARTMAQAARNHDVIICSAGSCEGDEDHARGAMMDCGGVALIAGVAVRPGKPVSFGAVGGKPCIALPGNPAAAYITFLTLGLPLLRHVAGAAPSPSVWQRVRAGFSCTKKPGLREFIRVRIVQTDDGSLVALKLEQNGSAMLRSLCAADGLAVLAENSTGIEAGDWIEATNFAALESP